MNSWKVVLVGCLVGMAVLGEPLSATQAQALKRLFLVPYGREQHQILLEPFGYEYPAEGSASTGPKRLRVSPDGQYVYIMTETKRSYNILQVFTQGGKFLSYFMSKTGDFIILENGNICIISHANNIDLIDTNNFDIKFFRPDGSEVEELKQVSHAYKKGVNNLLRLRYSNINLHTIDGKMRLYFSAQTDTDDILGFIDKESSISFINKLFIFQIKVININGEYFAPKISFLKNYKYEETSCVEYFPNGRTEKYERYRFGKFFINLINIDNKSVFKTIEIPNEKELSNLEADSCEVYESDIRIDARGHIFICFKPLKVNWQAVETPYGKFVVRMAPVLEYDANGRRIGLRAIIPVAEYGGPGSPMESWDFDRSGNLYYLQWTSGALEVWMAPATKP